MLRFAEADTDSASAFSPTGCNTAEPGKGVALFQALRAFLRARLQICVFSKAHLFARFQAMLSCPSSSLGHFASIGWGGVESRKSDKSDHKVPPR